jgi:inner membrane protein
MSPVSHFLTGWIVANTSQQLHRRERTMITLAAVAPDLDGLGIIAELLTRDSSHPLLWYSQYHHVLGHNLMFGLLLACIGFFLSIRKWTTAALVLVSFHLHLFCDLIGSRSPDGYQWPIAYLWPLSHSWPWTWDGQWELNAWPNFVITGVGLLVMFLLAWRRGYSPLEMVSSSANASFVRTLRRRFPVRV